MGYVIFVGFFYKGARETDYPAGEEVTQNAEAPSAGSGGSHSASSSSAGGEAVLGGITVVGCEAEGMTAVAQRAGGTEKDVEAGQPPLLSSLVFLLTRVLFTKWSNQQVSS